MARRSVPAGHREMLTAAKAQVTLLRDNIEGATRGSRQGGHLQRPESGFGVGVKSLGQIRRRRYANVRTLSGKQRRPMSGAVSESVVSFKHRHDLGVLGQARCVDDCEPVAERLP
jgi:hypothetical protein